MIVRGPLPASNFTVLANEVIRDERLSYRARGILIDLLSRPKDWRIDAEQIARHGGEGRRAILTALTELEAAGYLRRTKAQNRKTGRFVTFSVVVDNPEAETEVLLPHAGNPHVGDATAGHPSSGEYTALRSTVTKNRVEEVGAKNQDQESGGSTRSSDGLPAGRSLRDRNHTSMPKPVRVPKSKRPMTRKELDASWAEFRVMDLGDIPDDDQFRANVFVELIRLHGAINPVNWARARIEAGEWDGICGSFDLGNNMEAEWMSDDPAA